MSSTRVFFHIATVGRYKQIASELFSQIESSSLGVVAGQVSCGVVGKDALIWPLPAIGSRVTHSNDLLDFEFPTLIALQKAARSSPNCKFLYLHTKGATAREDLANPADYWRRYMAHFIIDRADECLRELESADVCGVDWRIDPVPHFSGNFWWARGEYLASLPDIATLAASERGHLISKRHTAEFWIGMGKSVRAASLFDCGVPVLERFKTPLPENWYLGRRGHLRWDRRMRQAAYFKLRQAAVDSRVMAGRIRRRIGLGGR